MAIGAPWMTAGHGSHGAEDGTGSTAAARMSCTKESPAAKAAPSRQALVA